MIDFGRQYKDQITGFTGICTGRCQYISGCNQALIAPKAGKDGSSKESLWFDECRLVPVGSKKINLNLDHAPGFDIPAPRR